MLRPMRSGGCSDHNEVGRPFLEECPGDSRCHIINGALCALIGLNKLEVRTSGAIHSKVTQRLVARYPAYRLRAAVGKARFVLGEDLG